MQENISDIWQNKNRDADKSSDKYLHGGPESSYC